LKRGLRERRITAASMVGRDVVRICMPVITVDLQRVAPRSTVAPGAVPVARPCAGAPAWLVRGRMRIDRALLVPVRRSTLADRRAVMRDTGPACATIVPRARVPARFMVVPAAEPARVTRRFTVPPAGAPARVAQRSEVVLAAAVVGRHPAKL
jgi:hypothetical protein